MKVRVAGYKKHSLVNGPGIRFALFFQGCAHRCRGCQNPDTWERSGGEETDTETLIRLIKETKFLDGVTLSGGDPFVQPEAAAEIAGAAKAAGLSVWAYSGWTLEELLAGKAGNGAGALLARTDVLVDGAFEEENVSQDCLYRGSTNQRLLDVPESLRQGKAVAWREPEEKPAK